MQRMDVDRPVGDRTPEILHVRAHAVATELRDTIARLSLPPADGEGASHLVSISGELDHLDAVVERTIELHPYPIPKDLVELHGRIDACIDAVVDLAGWAFDTQSADFANSAVSAAAKVEQLLAWADAPEGDRIAL